MLGPSNISKSVSPKTPTYATYAMYVLLRWALNYLSAYVCKYFEIKNVPRTTVLDIHSKVLSGLTNVEMMSTIKFFRKILISVDKKK